jgi:hypothetical protein
LLDLLRSSSSTFLQYPCEFRIFWFLVSHFYDLVVLQVDYALLSDRRCLVIRKQGMTTLQYLHEVIYARGMQGDRTDLTTFNAAWSCAGSSSGGGVSSLGKGFCLVPFPFRSLLELGLVVASRANGLSFLDGFVGDLLSGSSERLREAVVEHQTYMVRSHRARSYLTPPRPIWQLSLAVRRFPLLPRRLSITSPRRQVSHLCCNRVSEGTQRRQIVIRTFFWRQSDLLPPGTVAIEEQVVLLVGVHFKDTRQPGLASQNRVERNRGQSVSTKQTR